MTTTSERKDEQRATAELRPTAMLAPRGRRRPALLVAGLAMVVLGALAAIWLVSASGDRVQVVMLARDVAYGDVLSAGDLTTTAVAVDPAVAVIPAGAAHELVGQTATANLAAGSLLNRGEVTAAGVLQSGEVLVPLPLPADRMPAGSLAAGERLLVVDAPPAGADPPRTAPSSVEARVLRVGRPDVNGTAVVDVVASTGDGPTLATRAATGRFSIVVLPAATK